MLWAASESGCLIVELQADVKLAVGRSEEVVQGRYDWASH